MDLVSLISWTRPHKSTAAVILMNIGFWMLFRQRPVFVVSLAVLLMYLRYIWKHRIRSKVLVDPPDHEDWVTLSSYQLEHTACSLCKQIGSVWIRFRNENHSFWTIGTCTFWIMLAKMGTYLNFLTFLFFICNGAFLIVPLTSWCPEFENYLVKFKDKLETWLNHMEAPKKEPSPPISSPPTKDTSSDTTSRRTSAAAFVESIMDSFSSTTSQKPQDESSSSPTSSVLSPISSLLKSTLVRESSPGPESLTPPLPSMPDHEQVESDPEDEFLFDPKHFESSSSSNSNSFEIIDDL